MIVFSIINEFVLYRPVQKTDFLNWDAYHYHYILLKNYNLSNVAFFPLFPMVWSVLKLSLIKISIVNALLFLGGLFYLTKILNPKPLELLLYLTIPSFIFFGLPYSESTFFISSALMLVGFNEKKLNLILVGLFLASLTRPAFTVLIPALIITEYLSQNSTKEKIQHILAYLLTSGFGMILAVMLQYKHTGEWFAVFKVQERWDTYFRIPSFPLRSWAGGIPTRLDGIAFLFGIIAGTILLGKLIRIKKLKHINFPSEVIFSLAYLGGITLTVLFFRGGWLPSLNRYFFATAFFLVVLNFYFKSELKISWKHIAIAFVCINLYWFLFESYNHIQTILKFGVVSLIPILLLAIKCPKETIGKYALYILIGVNFIFQIFFYFRHLGNEWVG